MMHIADALTAAGFPIGESLNGPAGYDYARYFQEQHAFLALLDGEPVHDISAECGI